MSGQLRVIVAVIAVVAIAFVVYRHEHHSLALNTGGPPPIGVLVATRQIQKGTTGNAIRDAVLYRVAIVAKPQIENGAILDPSTLTGKAAVTDIPAGQQLTTADFAAGHPSIGGPSPNQRAVVLKPTSRMQIGRQITVGSHVDLWIAATGHGSKTLRKLYRNMFVLNTSTMGGSVTVRATPEQAGRLIYDSRKTNDRLVLRLHQ